MRYAACLLFEWKVQGLAARRRTLEERIVLIRASKAREALARAKRYGRSEQFSYLNADRRRLRIRFLGLRDLISLGPECGPNEVWYRFLRTQAPRRLVRKDSRLAVFQVGTVRSSWWAVPAFLAPRKKSSSRRWETTRA
ncbi:MAG: DUF4288 domain-containing protein [Thermoanaerobaculia bacterium]